MNSELLELLAEAGVGGEPRWKDVIVVQNYAPVPAPSACAGRWPWDRGFNFVVLERGGPSFFGKCRPAGDEALAHETEMRSCLGTYAGSLSVAPASSASSDRATVQVGPFIRGPHLGRVVPRQSVAAYLQTVRSVLDGAAYLADVASDECALWSPTAETVDVLARTTELLESIVPLAPLDDRLLDALSTAVSAAGTVPCRPQHVDLWDRNVLIEDGRLWAIDLEDYGLVQCPLYDDLTFVRSTLVLRPGYSTRGIERLAGPGAEARACREIVAERAASDGVDPAQLDGILAYHVCHRASTVIRRGGQVYARQYLDDVLFVARQLASGARDLLRPG